MYAVTSRSEPAGDSARDAPRSGDVDRGVPVRSPERRRPAVHGRAELGFARRSDATVVVAHLFQRAPLRVLFPRPPAGEPPQAVLANTAGGLVGGDVLEIAVDLAPRAAATVTAQAAEKLYRSAGPEVSVDISLRAGAEAWLEWLPQGAIVFDGAQLRRRTVLELDPGARALGGELLVFGRIGSGERLTRGLLRDVWEVRVGGRLVWTDRLRLDGDLATKLAAPAGFDGARAAATLIYAAPDAPDRLGAAREMLADLARPRLRAGVTCLGPLLVARWLGPDSASLRRRFGGFWAEFRRLAAGLPAALPRIWAI
jgi:urease accessory protein